MITSSVKCYTEWYFGNQFNERIEPFGVAIQVLVVSSYLAKIFIFLFVVLVFYETLAYFVKLKRMVLESQLLSLSCFNYFIIIAVSLLALVRISDTLTTEVITIIRIVKDVY